MYTRSDSLAAAIKADLLKPDRPRDATPKCFACGREFTPQPSTGDDNTERFCSSRCRDAYDNGAPRFEPQPDVYTKTWKAIAGGDPGFMPRPMRMGRHGFMIACAG